MSRFNWAARKLHKRLEQLGAQEFYPRGEADEQHEEGSVTEQSFFHHPLTCQLLFTGLSQHRWNLPVLVSGPSNTPARSVPIT